MNDKTYQWINIKDQMPPFDIICYLSCGTNIKFGALITINEEDYPMDKFVGIISGPRFSKLHSSWFAEIGIDKILHPTHWMPLPSLPTI